MATRKPKDHAAPAKASADPAQNAQHTQGGMQAIPKGAGPTASQQAYGDQSGDQSGDQGDMQQLDSMRLQMLMDKRAKGTEGLSNMMHKTSDTSEDITDNLK